MLVYYSALNLVRGIMLAHIGDIGGRSHGLQYRSGDTLLSCSASVAGRGTFRKFLESLGVQASQVDGKTFSLRDLFAVIPELGADFPLLNEGSTAVVVVNVQAFMRGDAFLRFHLPDMSEGDFASRWSAVFPWLAEVCELAPPKPFTLRLKQKPKDYDEVSEFCTKHLIHDLRYREEATWYDDRADLDVPRIHRLGAYLAALFILSNICRYEPELLDSVAREPSDLAYFLEEFFSCADRFFPQLILELLHGRPIFFE